MKRFILSFLAMAMWVTVTPALAAERKPVLDLTGYADASGAISVQRGGDTVDPYFTLQALLLAQANGLDIAALAAAWGEWLLLRQKPDATFDRYCRNGPVWAACKTADADDSLLGLWVVFADSLPASQRSRPAWVRSRAAARTALARLVDPARGVYLVSPVYQHGLFMDNLELWAHNATHPSSTKTPKTSFTQAIVSTFWDKERQRYLVSTQPGQRDTAHAFYPDAVAQIFPLLVNFPHLPGGARAYYHAWMAEHRSEWLAQVHHDFAWGLIAIAALQHEDLASARCWLQVALPYRHTVHWTVTDEVVAQILNARAIQASVDKAGCPQRPVDNLAPTPQ